jgi:glycine cleavage system H lipoate-binding protein
MTKQTNSTATGSEKTAPSSQAENRPLHPCLWMQAGVVKKKDCNHYYDCATCKYDAGMLKLTATGRHISWQDAMRKHDSLDRTCRHTMTGRADHRACPMNYNCSHCDFDQLFEETLSPAMAHGLGEITDIKGFKLDRSGYFHSGHTWARIEDGGVIRVGMDDFAFKVLGGPDGFDLPLTGKELNQNEAGWGIKQRDNFADVQSPINGIITCVNHGIRKSPTIPEQDPYKDGWLFTVHNSDLKGAVKDLMADEKSCAWLNQEVTALEVMIEEITGPLSADGGYLRSDVYGNLPALGWHNLTRKFLGT